MAMLVDASRPRSPPGRRARAAPRCWSRRRGARPRVRGEAVRGARRRPGARRAVVGGRPGRAPVAGGRAGRRGRGVRRRRAGLAGGGLARPGPVAAVRARLERTGRRGTRSSPTTASTACARGRPRGPPRRPPPRSPVRRRRRGRLRLLSSRASFRGRIGIEAAAAVAALVLALAGGRVGPPGPDRPRGPRRARGLARVRPRALERDARRPPALPRGLHAGGGGGARRRRGARRARPGPRGRSRGAFAVVLVASLAVSVGAVAGHRTDSGRPGSIAPARIAALSAFLRAHDGRAADEVASVAPSKAAQLIARDGRPVLVLASVDGRPLVTPRGLAAAVAAGRVRYVLLGDRCVRAASAACTPVARWVRATASTSARPRDSRSGASCIGCGPPAAPPNTHDRASTNVVAVTGGSAATSAASFGSPAPWTASATAAAFRPSPSVTTTR